MLAKTVYMQLGAIVVADLNLKNELLVDVQLQYNNRIVSVN
jgi:hypothetical protein